MIKYSLQNECLENIEAFSDEQMNREMAVIESVLEIYDKTILMMELSNKDVDIPDCSMFMESTFFQELNGTPTGNTPPATGGEGGAPAAQDGQQQNKGQTENAQKTPPTEAERKKYNSEHQFRQMNKKGNTENIFISIIAFIPRLLGFLIQSIVKFFKKLGNKETEKKAKDIANASDDDKKKASEQVGEIVDSSKVNDSTESQQPQPQQPQQQNKIPGAINVRNATTTWYDDSVITAIQGFSKILKDLDISANGNNPESMEDLNSYIQIFMNMQEKLKTDLPPVRQAFEQSLQKNWVDIPIGDQYENKKNAMLNAFNEISTLAEHLVGNDGVYSTITNKLRAVIDKATRVPEAKTAGVNKLNEVTKPLRDVVLAIKDLVKSFNVREKNLVDAYANYSKNIDAVWNALPNSDKASQPVMNNNPNDQGGQPQQPQEGGNPNGGQNQNNPANAR